MVFSSLEFIFMFLPCFLAIYYCLPVKLANLWIIVGSLFFYAYGVNFNPWYILLMVVSITVSFLLGILLGRTISHKTKTGILITGLVYNFAWLIIFKYMGLPLLMPIGISFYTFQISSYLIDVYRDDSRSERSIVRFGAYVMLFPQLIAGPIVTYGSMREQLANRKVTLAKIESGLEEFSIGLGLKVLLANRFGSLWYDIQSIGFDSITTPLAWMGIIAFSLQIYFDFYGYSLMAMGLGRMMGFELPVNFRHPYMSRSMTEFWRRWHITLGSWFRRYIYIPLGGNRLGKPRKVFNLLVVWLLTGMWHGSTKNFLLWGFFLFIIMVIEDMGLKNILEKVPVLGHIYMAILIPVSWCFFEITDLKQLDLFLGKLFQISNTASDVLLRADYLQYMREYGIFFIIGIFFCTDIPYRCYKRWKNNLVCSLILLVAFWLSVYCMYLGMDDPFLYYRF